MEQQKSVLKMINLDYSRQYLKKAESRIVTEF